ncbi:MAG: amidohydrolase/deacetylase family metallohydrolase [Thermomicrobiales bacterium]|nr:amidohydrolase/deacetylase family metallohydrolase [Thermomicrobiales bacterium]
METLPFDLVIQNGRLIDPGAGIDGYFDVGLRNGKVAAVGPKIDPGGARTVDARDKLVTPGLVDAHVHVYEGVSHYGIPPDPTCLAHGATTVLDAGSAGADTFTGFRKYIIEASETRILAMLNISSMGMLAEEVGELDDIKWANIPKALATIEANRDVILGVKVRLSRDLNCSEASGIRPLFLAREAADAAGLPLMIHPQDSWAESIDQVLAVLREGDIMTHMYHGMRHGILDEDGRIRASVQAARDRGVRFDVGHGQGSFNWDVCSTAMAQDFLPDTISSDLHSHNVEGPVFDLITTVSKFLLLGMPLNEALQRVTVEPAKTVGMPGQIGTLAVGAEGDVVVIEEREGRFDLVDSHDIVRQSPLALVPTAVIKGGRVVRNDA